MEKRPLQIEDTSGSSLDESDGREVALRTGQEIKRTCEQPLDKGAILDALFKLGEKLGIDIEVDDVEGLLGTEDVDFMGNLVTIGHIHGIDPERILEILGVPIVPTVEPDDESVGGVVEIAIKNDYNR